MASDKASHLHSQGPAAWLRISLVVAIGFALATTIAAGSTDSPYEDRLVDIALHHSHAPRWNSVGLNSGAVKALLLDYDNELAFKVQLAVEKYGDEAQDVLVRFGDDLTFQEVVRQYGESTIPVVAYFVKNDIASIRISHLSLQKSDAAITVAKGLWASLWNQEQKETDSSADQVSATYGPDLRGQQAIAMISRDGHQFLGQFVVDSHGQAGWVQTERAVDAVKSLFFSGAIDLEKKYKRGQPLQAVDVLYAGADVFFFAGAFKAMKFLRGAQQVRSLSIVKRTQLLGAPLLRKSALGRYVVKYGTTAGTAYLMVRHPSLLSGVLVTFGTWLGVPPFLAKLTGWGLLLTPLLLPILSLLVLALRMAGAMFRGASQGLQRVQKCLGSHAAPAV